MHDDSGLPRADVAPGAPGGKGIMPSMNASPPNDLAELAERIRAFATERDWHRFHTPKNLAMALVAEAGELVEPFQWLTPEQSESLSPAQHQAVKEEIADVLIYLTRLADLLGIDLLEAAAEKMAINAAKYPAERAHGNADKYDTFSQ